MVRNTDQPELPLLHRQKNSADKLRSFAIPVHYVPKSILVISAFGIADIFI